MLEGRRERDHASPLISQLRRFRDMLRLTIACTENGEKKAKNQSMDGYGTMWRILVRRNDVRLIDQVDQDY
ncbi:hypothetical protein NECAME_09243 [Necator americanus]|uniref:Uncharacterized protein n=1 Tax=Necator americanus TaxID=51031 RepID=W2TFI5_NECAM|nr:hypothetical protein NECAME_09243 [Necator americanus]ETN80349.1 hypothetical protein NECAME_09243 [Necator americanus]